jgi:hypothetical protein
MHRGVVCAKAILVIAIVDGNLDADRGVNKTDDGRRDADEVRVAAVGGAGETKTREKLVQLPL